MLDFLFKYFENYGAIFAFLATLLDSFPLGGLLIPEEAVLAFAGFISGNLERSPLLLIVLGTLGMILGQFINYKLGERYGIKLLKKMHLSQERIDQVNRFMKESSQLLNLIARFSSSMRAVIGVLMGSYKLPVKRYLKIELAVAISKSTFFTMFGYFFGKSTQELEATLGRIAALILLISCISVGISLYTSRHIFKSDTIFQINEDE